MKQQKKNKFLTFIFSFIPGAAEMYMGFMKQGLSLMALCAVSIVGNVYGMEFFFIPALILVWFYSFFHARNVASLSEEEFGNLSDAAEFVFDFVNPIDMWQGNEILIPSSAFLLIYSSIALIGIS